MQNELWMQPALQVSEAVLLPALERRNMNYPRFGNRFLAPSVTSDAFRPADSIWDSSETLALSTYVRPRGSMAGRSVLRAAGIQMDPYCFRRFSSGTHNVYIGKHFFR